VFLFCANCSSWKKKQFFLFSASVVVIENQLAVGVFSLVFVCFSQVKQRGPSITVDAGLQGSGGDGNLPAHKHGTRLRRQIGLAQLGPLHRTHPMVQTAGRTLFL